VLVVGSTFGQVHGAGAMIDHRNANNTGHILTSRTDRIPARHKKSIVNQREVAWIPRLPQRAKEPCAKRRT